jgi:hypothetical protein
MGATMMFAVTKNGDWYSFKHDDWFDFINSDCLASNQHLAEEVAKRENAKVAIVQVSVSSTSIYNPNK